MSNAEIRRTYLQLVLVLMVVVVAFDVGGIWAILHFTGVEDGDPWWKVSAFWVLRVVGSIVVLLAAPLLALVLVNMLFPLLGERVFYASMRAIAPARAEQLAGLPGLPMVAGVFDALRRLLLFLALSLLVMLLSLIPVVGAFGAPVLQGYFSARALAWELLDPYFDKRLMRFGAQREFVARHRPSLVGFGLPMTLVMAIPIVGPLLFGLAQAAAAKLVVEEIEASGEEPLG